MKRKNFVVIGLGRFGSTVARALAAMNREVLAIDINPESVESVASVVSHCVIADATKLSVLTDLGVKAIDHAVVAIGNNLQASILTTVNLRKLGVKNITVRADETGHKEVFQMLGAQEVIIPEEASAISLANQIISDGLLDYYGIDKEYAIVQFEVGEDFIPKTLIDLNLRNKFDINIVGIISNGKFFIPKGTDVINPCDIVVVVGQKQKIAKFDSFMNN